MGSVLAASPELHSTPSLFPLAPTYISLYTYIYTGAHVHTHREARVLSMYNRRVTKKGRQEIGEGTVVDSDAKSTTTSANEANRDIPPHLPKPRG